MASSYATRGEQSQNDLERRAFLSEGPFSFKLKKQKTILQSIFGKRFHSLLKSNRSIQVENLILAVFFYANVRVQFLKSEVIFINFKSYC